MERVAFIVESGGTRIDCMLNPESLCVRRRAGIAASEGQLRPLSLSGRTDDPLLFTGGGITELELELLFDVALDPRERARTDVRELTAPLWELAENRQAQGEFGAPPLVRFVWGKTWNIPGYVVSASERLERFSPAGAPRRSWLHLRLRRMQPAATRHVDLDARDAAQAEQAAAIRAGHALAGRTTGEGAARLGEVARFDNFSAQNTGNPALWRWIAELNGIDDPFRIDSETVLRVPHQPQVTGSE